MLTGPLDEGMLLVSVRAVWLLWEVGDGQDLASCRKGFPRLDWKVFLCLLCARVHCKDHSSGPVLGVKDLPGGALELVSEPRLLQCL